MCESGDTFVESERGCARAGLGGAAVGAAVPVGRPTVEARRFRGRLLCNLRVEGRLRLHDGMKDHTAQQAVSARLSVSRLGSRVRRRVAFRSAFVSAVASRNNGKATVCSTDFVQMHGSRDLTNRGIACLALHLLVLRGAALTRGRVPAEHRVKSAAAAGSKHLRALTALGLEHRARRAAELAEATRVLVRRHVGLVCCLRACKVEEVRPREGCVGS